jgi:hypothetical protein
MSFRSCSDFVYFGDLNIQTENAEALRYLAEFLQCRPLRQAVNKFIESDFNVNTSIHYVSETHRFNDKPLLTVAIRESAKLFGFIEIDDFTRLEPDSSSLPFSRISTLFVMIAIRSAGRSFTILTQTQSSSGEIACTTNAIDTTHPSRGSTCFPGASGEA